MGLWKQLPESNEWAHIIVPQRVRERLTGTCFRGRHLALAGNFSHFQTAGEVLGNRQVCSAFLNKLEELRSTGFTGTRALSILLTDTVGWESTQDIADLDPDVLERFRLNRRATALRVKSDRRDVRAPQTKDLTLVYEVCRDGRDIVAIVRSMYPGYNIGKLEGDVSKRENRVFFDWDHPGE